MVINGIQPASWSFQIIVGKRCTLKGDNIKKILTIVLSFISITHVLYVLIVYMYVFSFIYYVLINVAFI